jgi:Family of unknown function (DUF6247)
VTAEPTGHQPTIGERVDYTRSHLPDDERDLYEGELRAATARALETGDYGPLGDVVEQWWRAAHLEHRGGEAWQRQKRLIQQGRWDELFPGPARDVDEIVRELLR